MKTYETTAGKIIEPFIVPNTQHFKIRFTSGGELPEELSGIYTSEKDVEKAVLIYLDRKNGQSTSRKTGK